MTYQDDKKHTPGPWRYAVNVGPTKGLIVDSDGYTILEILNGLRDSRFEANLKTICHRVNAFDDMLEALENALSVLDAMCKDGIGCCPNNAVHESARAAIAKAKGGDNK